MVQRKTDGGGISTARLLLAARGLGHTDIGLFNARQKGDVLQSCKSLAALLQRSCSQPALAE